MASYTEASSNKLDWAMPFQRTGQFPLDRSYLFATYADAVKYAAANPADPDLRELYGTSYIGQMVAVFENDSVQIYKINADRSIAVVGGGSASLDLDMSSISLNSGSQLQIAGFTTAIAGQFPVVRETSEGSGAYRIMWETLPDYAALNDALAALTTRVDTAEEDIIANADAITALDTAKANKVDVYTKTEIDGKLTGALHYKGSQPTFQDLLDTITAGTYTPAAGDVWNIEQTGGVDEHGQEILAGDNVIYNEAGPGWDKSSGTIDLSEYSTGEEVTAEIAAALAPVNTKIGQVEASVATNTANIATNTADIEAAETAIGTNTANIATNATDIETLDAQINTATTGIAAVVNKHTTDIATINGADTVEGSTSKKVKDAIAAHNSSADAHIEQFALYQTKSISVTLTINPLDYTENDAADAHSAYYVRKTIAELNADKDYIPFVVGSTLPSERVYFEEAGFLAVATVNAGVLQLDSVGIATGPVTVYATFLEA